MALIEPLRGARVIHIDTAPIIYLIEENPKYFGVVAPIVRAIDAGEIRATSSFVTLIEVLVKPFERREIALVERYRDALLRRRNLDVIELGAVVAEQAARIRADHHFQIADSIQLATAQIHGADAFLTNDTRLVRFPAVRVVALEHHALH